MTGLWKSRPAKFWRDPKGSPRKPPERPVPLLERPWKLPTYSGLTDPDPPKGQTWKTPKNAEKKEMKTEKPTFSSGSSGCWPSKFVGFWWKSTCNYRGPGGLLEVINTICTSATRSFPPSDMEIGGYIEKWHLAISYDISHELHCIQYIH